MTTGRINQVTTATVGTGSSPRSPTVPTDSVTRASPSFVFLLHTSTQSASSVRSETLSHVLCAPSSPHHRLAFALGLPLGGRLAARNRPTEPGRSAPRGVQGDSRRYRPTQELSRSDDTRLFAIPQTLAARRRV